MGSVMGSERGPEAGASFGKTPPDNKVTYYSRRAHHAGSWYEDDATELRDALESYLRDAVEESPSLLLLGQPQPSQRDGDESPSPPPSPRKILRGAIVPHAGYRYSGRTAAHAYAALRDALSPSPGVSSSAAAAIEHVIVLHPSHHAYLDGCAVSGARELQTPLGPLPVDDRLRSEVLQLSCRGDGSCSKLSFTLMSQRDDEHEHSGEMQYPYLAHVLASSAVGRKRHVSVLPIMVGALSTSQEERYGRLLAPILARPSVLAVVSSDFCHWGSRFSYRPTPPGSSGGKAKAPIHEFISQLDRDGMNWIELQKPGMFAQYLKETQNTICGRHPISVWLHAITSPSSASSSGNPGDGGPGKMEVTFVKYAQSSPVESMHESSVSYAAALATLREPGPEAP
jgi:AmmeMemoRadiSam system protein B